MENVREIVLDTLIEWEREKEFSHRLIKAVLDKYDYLDGRDKAFIKRLTEGTIERKIELDYYLNHYSSVPVRKMKPLIRSLLRMSVYQIIYMDTVPDSAACNEACKLAQKRKFQNLKGFVNAVLRKVAKEKESLPFPNPEKEYEQYLSVKYSMPEWLIQMWRAEYGDELTETMLKGLLMIHPVTLRFSEELNEKQVAEAVKTINETGVSLSACKYDERIYTAENMENPDSLPGFEEGLFTIQDASSAIAVKSMGIQKNHVVMDVCAAPGGKSILAGELAKSVYSSDISAKKVDRMQENMERCKRDNVQVRVQDALVFDPTYEECADVLILDVPCSGLGILGKKRDIKYHITQESLASITELQKQIVETCYRYVKPGGILMYSTCTVRKEENQNMITWILGNLPFKGESVRENLPKALQEEADLVRGILGNRTSDDEEEACMCQLFPGRMETDGFFFAKLRRVK